MASSRKSNLADTVAARLAPLVPEHQHILIGLSGGLDSVVLLHLLHSLAPRFSWQLSALHVHHGISPNADAWAGFCTDLCCKYSIPLQIEHVDIAPLRSEHGIEAAARQLRHEAFARQECNFVALAHHADDQVETLLLQLLRGAGIKGAAAMPILSEAEKSHADEIMSRPAAIYGHPVLRPLLEVARSALLEYAKSHSLGWIEDESNADERYPRNFLRHQVLPLLEQRFPAYRDTLTRSARHFAEGAQLLDELAQQDGRGLAQDQWLDLSRLRELSVARAKNLLRHFLYRHGAVMPHSAQLDEMLHQALVARVDAAVCVKFGNFEFRRYNDRVYVLEAQREFDRDLVLRWQGEASLEWPALNRRLSFSQTEGQGISLARLGEAPVTLRLRRGGERMRPQSRAATRSLKNLLQEHLVPPWQRERLPLLYCGDALACVVGVAVAAEFQATAIEPGIVVE